MKKILAYGIYLDRNFGGPSIVHGLIQTLRRCDRDCKIVLYHSRPVPEKEKGCCPVPVKQMPFGGGRLLMAYFVRKFIGIVLHKNSVTEEFWRDFDDSDVVVNLYGICFCDKFNQKRKPRIKLFRAIYSAISMFPLSFIARFSGKRSVKCTASYGPIVQDLTRSAAKWAARICFSGMIARERESLRQMRDVAKVACEMAYAPDIANAMPYRSKEPMQDEKSVGLSVSFQIIKQWGGDKRLYYECIRSLIGSILEMGHIKVILFPNELKCDGVFDDAAVAAEIKQLFSDSENVRLFDIETHTSLDLKNAIAQCEAMVASRYHSCVASLSAGVPLLVVGWHYKYEELLDLYGQREWLLSVDNCTPDVIVSKFEKLWNEKVRIRENLLAKKESVLESLNESGRFILGYS